MSAGPKTFYTSKLVGKISSEALEQLKRDLRRHQSNGQSLPNDCGAKGDGCGV